MKEGRHNKLRGNKKMNQIRFAKLFLVVSVAVVVISTIDAAPESMFACPCPRMRWQVCDSDRFWEKNLVFLIWHANDGCLFFRFAALMVKPTTTHAYWDVQPRKAELTLTSWKSLHVTTRKSGELKNFLFNLLTSLGQWFASFDTPKFFISF